MQSNVQQNRKPYRINGTRTVRGRVKSSRHIYIRTRCEELSGFWYALFTIDVLLGALLIWWSVSTPAPKEIRPQLEKFEHHEVEVKPIGIQPHNEMLTCGVIVDDNAVEILARIIHGEAGSNWCSDQMQAYVGSVFMNRVASDLFPNTFKEVAFQTGQYSCTNPGSGYWQEPTERDIAMARNLLENGSQLENDYLWQANFKQGRDVIQVQNMYFGRR